MSLSRARGGRRRRIEREIRRFLDREVLDGATATGDPFAEGLIDSLATEQLLAFVEDRYGVVFADQEVAAERFSSVAAVAGSILAKLEQGTR